MRKRMAWALAVLAAGIFLIVSGRAPDTGITAEVRARFAADDVVKAAEIEVVEARCGVVTLRGNVDSEGVRERALELARATTGVVSVVDMLAARTASRGGDAPRP